MSTDKKGPITLTQDQGSHLADLVSLAMVGFALIKKEGVEAKDHPAIQSFLPLVEADLAARRKDQMERAALRYDLEDPGAP